MNKEQFWTVKQLLSPHCQTACSSSQEGDVSSLLCPREKAPLGLMTDNTNEPYKGNNGLLHAFDSLLQF